MGALWPRGIEANLKSESAEAAVLTKAPASLLTADQRPAAAALPTAATGAAALPTAAAGGSAKLLAPADPHAVAGGRGSAAVRTDAERNNFVDGPRQPFRRPPAGARSAEETEVSAAAHRSESRAADYERAAAATRAAEAARQEGVARPVEDDDASSSSDDSQLCIIVDPPMTVKPEPIDLAGPSPTRRVAQQTDAHAGPAAAKAAALSANNRSAVAADDATAGPADADARPAAGTGADFAAANVTNSHAAAEVDDSDEELDEGDAEPVTAVKELEQGRLAFYRTGRLTATADLPLFIRERLDECVGSDATFEEKLDWLHKTCCDLNVPPKRSTRFDGGRKSSNQNLVEVLMAMIANALSSDSTPDAAP